MLTLACGPFFSELGAGVSLATLLLVKPLTYVAFIQAFRFRVSREIPMGFGRAAALAGIRALAGLALIGLTFVAFRFTREPQGGLTLAWGALIAERVLVWGALGYYGASIVGRRLVGWTVSGAAIDAAFDIAAASSLFDQWPVFAGVILAVVLFIAALTAIGRRDSLKARFIGGHLCRHCQYDLTGNLSGRCPECGTLALAPRPA